MVRGVFDMPIGVLKTLPIWFAATLFSMTLHEAAHALFGKLGGDRTAEDQVTLDPTPHIAREPMGMIAIPVLTFFLHHGSWMMGWASAPYDPVWAERHPRKAALMAAAGPLSNFLLALVVGVILLIMVSQLGWQPGLAAGYSDAAGVIVGAEGQPTAMSSFLSILFTVNLLLGAFNLIPIAPLDGHAVVAAFMPDKVRRRWFGLFEDSSTRMIGMLIAWVIFSRVFVGPMMTLLAKFQTLAAGLS